MRGKWNPVALFAALAIAVAGVSSGCVAVIAGAGTGAVVGFSMGKLDTELAKPIDRTEKATHDAIAQLQFAAVSENADAFNAEYISRTASDTKVKIELTKKDDQITKVEIRVGVFGDKDESIAILERIKANLGE